jgi:DNA-directed RNA polymerase specialized sigma24 family protein
MSEEADIPDDLEAEPDNEPAEDEEVDEDAVEEEDDGEEDADEEEKSVEHSPVVEAALRRRDPARAQRADAKLKAEKKQALAKPKKSSEYEVMQRRKDVLRLRMRGHAYKEIADKLKISVNTVKNDLNTVREDAEKQVKGFRQEHFVGETMTVFDDIMARAWEEFFACSLGSKQRIAALDLVRVTQNDKFKALADVGMITKASQEVTHRHVHEMPWDEHLQQQVIQGMLSRALTPQLEAPEPDPTHGPGKNIQEGEIVVSEPEPDEPKDLAEEKARARAERVFNSLVSHGMSPEEARKVLAQEKAKAP